MSDKPVEIAERWKYLYNSPSEQNGHNLIFDELIEQLSAAEARVKELELCCYPHKCCDEHEEIGHCNSEREGCPLCRALDENASLREQVEQLKAEKESK